MPNSRVLGFIVCVAVLAGGATLQAAAADAESFKTAYEAADAARKKAASVGYEWRDTKKILKQAKKAADGGDFAKAETLAIKAQKQGEAGVAQAAEQEEAWKSAVLR